MAHENLILRISLSKIQEAVSLDKTIRKRTKKGDSFVTLYCDERKEEGFYGETHSIHVGKIDGKKFYVGRATPSKFQPTDDTDADTETNQNDNNMPW